MAITRFAAVFTLAALLTASAAWAQPPRAQSTTGPTPPPGVSPAVPDGRKALKEIPGVPGYSWRHGCAPTVVGMLMGYWDGAGYDTLIAGDASTQTADVDQAIASGGVSGAPNPAGSEQHYEDYATPEDAYPNLETDDCITAGRTPHADDCIADLLLTSRSEEGNYYGWTWSSEIQPAIEAWVAQNAPQCSVDIQCYTWNEGFYPAFTWEVFTGEMDNNRPVVMLVDTDGDGSTDHFVTAVGYDDSSGQQYGCLDTWAPAATVRWEDFAPVGNAWGISYAWTVDITGPAGNVTFTKQPLGGLFEEGDALNLEVAVTGTTDPTTYQWIKDGAAIGGATSSTYAIPALTLDDTGVYWCVVTDATKAITESIHASVTVVPTGGLPASGGLGLALLAGACALTGAWRVRRRRG